MAAPLGFKRIPSGSRVVVEGPKCHGRYWAFFVDTTRGGGGNQSTNSTPPTTTTTTTSSSSSSSRSSSTPTPPPLRLSTETREDLDGWIKALERMGCQVEYMANFTTTKDITILTGTHHKHNRKSTVSSTTATIPHSSPAAATTTTTKFIMKGYSPTSRRSIFSALSSERYAELSSQGLLNLGIILLVVTNFRLILENLSKYGILANPIAWARGVATVHPELIVGMGAIPALIVGCWAVEVWAATLAARRPTR